MNKLSIMLIGILANHAFCQEQPVTTEILTLALDEQVSGLYFHNGKEIAVFQANPTGLGEPLAYKGPRRFTLRACKADFSVKPPLPEPEAWVDLPDNSDRVLVACLKNGAAPLKLVAFDIGRDRIGAGDYRFFNFSHSVVATVFGGRKFSINPGESTMVSDEKWKKEVGELDLVMAIANEGKYKPVYASQWGNRPGRRNYVFIFNGPQEYKPLRICRFFDVPPANNDKTEP